LCQPPVSDIGAAFAGTAAAAGTSNGPYAITREIRIQGDDPLMTHPNRWTSSAVGGLLVLLAVTACGPAATKAGAGHGSTAPTAASPSPSASPAVWTITDAAAKSALPAAAAAADGWSVSTSETLRSAYLCIKPAKLPDEWTSEGAAWTRTRNGVAYVLEVHVSIADGAITPKDAVAQAIENCPEHQTTTQLEVINKPLPYWDSTNAWNGSWNRNVGTLTGSGTFTESTYLVARGNVLVLASVLAVPGYKDVEGPEKVAKTYLDDVLTSLSAA
jgi:hypothetical protein